MLPPEVLVPLGAILLGIRHVLDPDHVVAVAELVAFDDNRTGRAALLGAAWGLGHSSVLFLAGLAMSLLGFQVPGPMQKICERAVGVIIVYFAARIFLAWLRGDYALPRNVMRESTMPRSPMMAFAIGAVHGVAGSGAVILLLIDSMEGAAGILPSLLIFGATMTAAMTVTTLVGARSLRSDRTRRLWASHGAPFGSLAAASFGVIFFLSV